MARRKPDAHRESTNAAAREEMADKKLRETGQDAALSMARQLVRDAAGEQEKGKATLWIADVIVPCLHAAHVGLVGSGESEALRTLLKAEDELTKWLQGKEKRPSTARKQIELVLHLKDRADESVVNPLIAKLEELLSMYGSSVSAPNDSPNQRDTTLVANASELDTKRVYTKSELHDVNIETNSKNQAVERKETESKSRHASKGDGTSPVPSVSPLAVVKAAIATLSERERAHLCRDLIDELSKDEQQFVFDSFQASPSLRSIANKEKQAKAAGDSLETVDALTPDQKAALESILSASVDSPEDLQLLTSQLSGIRFKQFSAKRQLVRCLKACALIVGAEYFLDGSRVTSMTTSQSVRGTGTFDFRMADKSSYKRTQVPLLEVRKESEKKP